MSEANWTQVRNILGMTNLLLLAVIVLLLWHLLHTPRTVGRFQGFRDDTRYALDTKTGKLCSTVPRPPLTEQELDKEPPKVEIPVCSDLE